MVFAWTVLGLGIQRNRITAHNLSQCTVLL
jgi:hypothetical protein